MGRNENLRHGEEVLREQRLPEVFPRPRSKKWVVSVPADDRAAPAPTRIEANLEYALGFLDAVVESEAVVLDEQDVAGAEVVVIVLGEAREPVGEGVLAADTDRPSAAGRWPQCQSARRLSNRSSSRSQAPPPLT